MEGVQFEEETIKSFQPANYQQVEQESKMIKLLIKAGLVKDKKHANIFLITMVVIFILASVLVLNTRTTKVAEIVPYDQMTPDQKLLVPAPERAFLESQQNNN